MKKFVFVLMPFSSDFDDIYRLGIKEISKDVDVYIERVDEQIYEGSMLDRIYNQIQHADFLIADLTSKNPNVFYEVGYAHALAKKVILITQEGDDIPFDMKHFYHIIYKSNKIHELKKTLQERVQWHLNDDDSQNIYTYPFDFLFNDVDLDSNQLTEVYYNVDELFYNDCYIYRGSISVAYKNNTYDLMKEGIRVSLITSRDFPPISWDRMSEFALPNNKKKILIANGDNMRKEEWRGIAHSFEWVSDSKISESFEASLEATGYTVTSRFPILFKTKILNRLSEEVAQDIYDRHTTYYH